MRTYAVFVRREGVAYIQAENEDEAYAAAAPCSAPAWRSAKTSHGTIIIRLKTCRRNEDKYIS